MANGLLKSGAKPAPGGKRKGAGRKPDWLKTKCQELIDRHKLLEYLANVAAGNETEERVGKDGVIVTEVTTHDRLHALEMLMERGYGKAVQGVEVGGKDGAPVAFDVVIKVGGS